MSPKTPIGIIELGNLHIRCLIFQINSKNDVEILSASKNKSDGIHNNVIVNLSKAAKSIRECIGEAEKKAKISLKKINVVLEEPEFLSTRFSKHKKINGSKIHKEDIEFLLQEAKKQLTLNDKKQSIIHIFNHNYIVDGKIFIEEPIGVYADSISHEMTFITMPKNNLKNINQAFIDCDIEIERLISSTFALGANLLSKKDLEFGSVIIDMGFEKISLGIFKNFALIHSTTFPIGVNHITKDLSKVCSLNIYESEKIRNNLDFVFSSKQKIFENDYLKKDYFVNTNFRKISRDLILNVTKARLDEIADRLKKQIVLAGFDLNFAINILLTGGGSNISNIEKYFINFFGTSVRKIDETNSYEDKNNYLEKNFSACLGALKIIKDGWETEAIPETVNKNIEKIGFLAKIFRIR